MKKGMLIIMLGLLGGFLLYLRLPLDKELFPDNAGTSVKITDRHGILLRETLSAEGGKQAWLTYTEIPDVVKQTVIQAEDKRFRSHGGVDVWALGRAIVQNLRALRVVSGASTITQQLVKIRFGYPRTLIGKLKEMIMAIRLEHTLSKAEILTQYLNRVDFSNQTIGIESAARLYFQKPARHLSLAESIFLVGLIQAPSYYNPYRQFERAMRRQRNLLERMHQSGSIDDARYRIARQEEIRLTPKQVNFKAPHFCEVILKQVWEAGKMPAIPHKTIKTTLDYYLQQKIEAIVAARIAEVQDYNVTNAAVLVLENRTGDVVAYVGSKDFFDDATAGQVNGVLALRQPGSALKPFTYQLALERAYTPATLLPDIKEYPAAPRSYTVENYDRKFHGPVRLRQALACSYNVPPVRILETIGVEALYARLHEFGFASLRQSPAFYGPGLTLGNGEVTLLELTRAYAMLARRGQGFQERYILEPTTAEAVTTSQQLFAPQTVYLISHILADRQAAVPAFGEHTPLDLPFPTAVKTGTSKDYRDNWTVGYTSEYTVGVWVGNFDGSSMQRVSGITGAGPIYRDIMLTLYRDHDPPALLADPPTGIVTARICPLSGQLLNDDCPHGIDEVFLEGTAPAETCAMHRAYWVDATDGLLTDPASPNAIKKVFIHFPPLYQAWARKMGFPAPPTQYSTSATAPIVQRRAAQTPPGIEIVHPNNGDVYALDPILRREYQTVQLSAVVPSEIPQVTWYVDNTQWETVEAPFQATWQISPGTHRIYAEGLYRGTPVRSQEITVIVVE